MRTRLCVFSRTPGRPLLDDMIKTASGVSTWPFMSLRNTTDHTSKILHPELTLSITGSSTFYLSLLQFVLKDILNTVVHIVCCVYIFLKTSYK